MKRYALVGTSWVLGFSALQPISLAYAQGQGAGGPLDQITALLLRPAGWIADWSTTAAGGDKGRSEIIFESRGEHVVAKLRNLSHPITCESDVKITADLVSFDGCYHNEYIRLAFDPDDPGHPFKGTSGSGYHYSLSPQ